MNPLDLLASAAAALGGGKKPKECSIHHVPTREVRKGDKVDYECAECARLHRSGGTMNAHESFDDTFKRELDSQRRLVDIVADDAAKVLSEAQLDTLQDLAEAAYHLQDDSDGEKPTTIRVEVVPRAPALVPIPTDIGETEAEKELRHEREDVAAALPDETLRMMLDAVESGATKRGDYTPEVLSRLDSLKSSLAWAKANEPVQTEAQCETTSTDSTTAGPLKSNSSPRSSKIKGSARKSVSALAKKAKRSKPNAKPSKAR